MEKLPLPLIGEIVNHLCWPTQLPNFEDLYRRQARQRYHPDDEQEHWYQQDALNLAATCKKLRAQVMPLLWKTVTVIVMQDTPDLPLSEYHWAARSKAQIEANSMFVLNCMWEEDKPVDYFKLVPPPPTDKPRSKRQSLKSFFGSSSAKKDTKSANPTKLPMESALAYIQYLRVYAFADRRKRTVMGTPKHAVEKSALIWSLINPTWMPRLEVLEIELLVGPDFTEPTTKLQEQLESFDPPPEVEIVMSQDARNLFGL